MAEDFSHIGDKIKELDVGIKGKGQGLQPDGFEIKETDLVLKPKFEKDLDGVLDWWKPKAIKRYTNLVEQGRLNDEILYYNQMCGLTWEQAKEKFLGDVGR